MYIKIKISDYTYVIPSKAVTLDELWGRATEYRLMLQRLNIPAELIEFGTRSLSLDGSEDAERKCDAVKLQLAKMILNMDERVR